MTEDQSKLLSIFEFKIRQFMLLCDDLKKENDDLKKQLEKSEKEYKEINEENKTIKTKYDNLKMAKMISFETGDFKAAKNRISKLVKEVDKCIALLNE